jgi:hypothetical protein
LWDGDRGNIPELRTRVAARALEIVNDIPRSREEERPPPFISTGAEPVLLPAIATVVNESLEMRVGNQILSD